LGFTWTLERTAFMGTWYLPGTAIWYAHPFAGIGANQTRMLLLSANVLAARNAMTAVIFLGLLNGCARQMGQADAIAYVGPVFAAIAALMYPIFIALLARL